MKKHRPLNLDMNRIHENQEINQRSSLEHVITEITKSNVNEFGYDYLKSKLYYKKELSSYTERLIVNEIKIRQSEMDNYKLSDLNNLSTSVLSSIKSKINRYPIEFENEVKKVLLNKNMNNERDRKSSHNIQSKYNNLVFLIIFIFIAICAVITNPTPERQKEILKTKIYSLIQNSAKEEEKESDGQTKSVGRTLGFMLGKPIIDYAVDNSIGSDNYVLFSTILFSWDGDAKIIGIGVFGNVFVFSRFDDAINEVLLKNKK
ncbi:MAG: hypothetical protein ACOYMA_20705 [Bacteroidia bacterium]